MDLAEMIVTPAAARALVVGAFGGAGLVLTVTYSRRGPLIFPVYAAVLAALTWTLSRHAFLPYGARYAAALGGFLAASVPLFAASMFLGARERRRLRVAGRLPSAHRRSWLAYAGPAVFLLVVGAVVSAGVAFIAG